MDIPRECLPFSFLSSWWVRKETTQLYKYLIYSNHIRLFQSHQHDYFLVESRRFFSVEMISWRLEMSNLSRATRTDSAFWRLQKGGVGSFPSRLSELSPVYAQPLTSGAADPSEPQLSVMAPVHINLATDPALHHSPESIPYRIVDCNIDHTLGNQYLCSLRTERQRYDGVEKPRAGGLPS